MYGQHQEGSDTGRDFLSVSIVNGFVEFRYNLGSGPAVLRSLKKVILGMWHSVSVKRWHQVRASKWSSLDLDPSFTMIPELYFSNYTFRASNS